MKLSAYLVYFWKFKIKKSSLTVSFIPVTGNLDTT